MVVTKEIHKIIVSGRIKDSSGQAMQGHHTSSESQSRVSQWLALSVTSQLYCIVRNWFYGAGGHNLCYNLQGLKPFLVMKTILKKHLT